MSSPEQRSALNRQVRPAAFLSYAHTDDDAAGKKISALREKLTHFVSMQTGSDFWIFQDRTDIGLGEDWRNRIEGALYDVMFLIPFVTPRYLRSPACRDELERFQHRERELGRTDLILPIYFVDCPEMQDPACSDPVVEIIRKHQYSDWRGQWFAPLDSPQMEERVFQLATQIMQALRRGGPAQDLYEQPSSGERQDDDSGKSPPAEAVRRAPTRTDAGHDARPSRARASGTTRARRRSTPVRGSATRAKNVLEVLVDGRVKEARQEFAEFKRADAEAAARFEDELARPCRAPQEVLIPAGPYSLGVTLEQAQAIASSVASGGYNVDLSSKRARSRFVQMIVGSGRREANYPAFWLDRYLVTNDQFARFVLVTGYETELERRAEGGWLTKITAPQLLRHPVVLISSRDAENYARWTGRRLPLEDEWDRAAHGPAGLAYPWGNTYVATNCNGVDNLRGYETCPVNMFESTPSPFNVVDLVGNVDEITGSSDGPLRIVVGGSWRMTCEIYGLSGSHRLAAPGFASEEVGFRTARDDR